MRDETLPSKSSFLFVTCQAGAEGALKGELARRWPTFRFAYSRPGFVTFKLPDDHGLAEDFDLESTFARAYGFSLGRVQGDSDDVLAEKTWRLIGDQPFEHLHVWPRDALPAGEHGYAPGFADDSRQVSRKLVAMRAGHVYELRVEGIAPEGRSLFPAEAYYTLRQVP